jgi:hypothetical protein
MGGSKWVKFILMSGAVILWQIYDLSTAIEAPPQTLLVLQYGLLALAARALDPPYRRLLSSSRSAALSASPTIGMANSRWLATAAKRDLSLPAISSCVPTTA